MSASEKIDAQIAALKDWRGQRIAQLRKIIRDTDPQIVEEWKWDTGIWSKNGMICAIGSFKDHVKVNFFNGAAIKDPGKLFNAGLEAKKTRAIDLYEKDKLNERAFKDLIREAIAYNETSKKKK
jgi:hypothetical protein